MKGQYVQDLREGVRVDGHYAIVSKALPRTYKNRQGSWFSFVISDTTGTIDVKYWGGPDENSTMSAFSSLQIGDVLHIGGGTVSTYQGHLEVHLNEESCVMQKAENASREDFVRASEKDIPGMVLELRREIESITDPQIQGLLKSIFDDGAFMEIFSAAPASVNHHHGYAGGLLEHVVSMIAASKTIAGLYKPDLNLDLLVAGCMLHDIGKVETYEIGITIKHTALENLLGHVTIGADLVRRKIDAMDDFSPELKNKILHMILSHHGTKEYGSPVVPDFPEAVALNKIDDCDAQLKYAIQKKKLLKSDDEAVSTV